MHARTLTAAALAVPLLGPLAATSAHATAVVDGIQTLSTPGRTADDPYVGLADDGTALATWTENGRLRWALRGPGGQWGFARPVPGAGTADVVSFDEAADGTAVLAWTDLDKHRVMAAVRPAGGGFGSAVPLSGASTATESAVSVSAAPGGQAAVTWVWQDGATTRIRAALHRPGNPGFAVTTLETTSSTGVHLGSPQVGIDSAGRALAVWDRTDISTNDSVRYAAAPGDSAFDAAQDLAPVEQGPATPRLSVSPTGAALIAYEYHVYTQLTVRTGDVTGAFGAAQAMLGDGQAAYAYQPAISPDGSAALLASINDHGSALVAGALADATGQLGPLESISAHDRVTGPGLEDDDLELSPAGGGEFYAVWENDHGDAGVNQAWSSTTAGGGFGTPTLRSPAGADVGEVYGAANADGDTITTWTTFTSSTVAQATPAVPDTLAPSLTGIRSGPSPFTAGTQTWRLHFVPSEDVRVTVTITRDGTKVATLARRELVDAGTTSQLGWSGRRAGHLVPAGTYRWKLSAVDAGGNTTTEHGSLRAR
ncbi:MAG TPA: hypothetical protein VNS55_11255 [Nocardioides sp.]|nr:hypothetical protein [Nocardioides sp.]